MLAKKSAKSFIITLILMVVTACGGSDAKFEDPAEKTVVKTPTDPVDLGSTVTPSPSPTPVATVVPMPTSVPTATPTATPQVSEIDADQDGSNVTRDCNDNDASIHPRADDIPGDGIDQNCSGADNYLAKVLEKRQFFSADNPELQDNLYHEIFYGSAGKIRKEIYYKEPSKILKTVEYHYDDKGYLVKKIYADSKDGVIYTESIENDKTGKKIVLRLVNEQTDELETVVKYQYNPDETLRREVRTNAVTGEIDWITEYSYVHGKIDSVVITKEDGTLLVRSVYEYRLGGLLKKIMSKKVMPDGSTQFEEQRYTYNTNGQVSTLAVYQNDKKYSVSTFTYELAE